jgi:hypothetical protein
MSCVNFNHPEYIKLKNRALLDGRDSFNFKLDMDIFDTEEGRWPISLEDLDKGVQKSKDRGRMNDVAVYIATVNSPAFSNEKKNIFEFRVVEGSDKINTRDQAIEVAKKVMDKLNEQFNYPGSPNFARLETKDIVKVIIENNQKFLDSFLTKEESKRIADSNEYFESETESDLEATQRAEQELLDLLGKDPEEGGVNQFCSN